MSAIHAYIFLPNGQCKEAMEFYHSCIGGELFVQTIGESPAKEQFPADQHDRVMHASISKGDLLIMSSDYMGEGEFQQGNSISLSLTCDSKEELDSVFEKLSQGGTIYQAPKAEFWGDIFGQLNDKYGFSWMVMYTPPKEQ